MFYKTSSSSKRVLLSGYYGFGNTGDEAILQAAVEGFKKSGLIPVVLTHTPEKTASWLNIETYGRRETKTILNGIRKSDLVLSGGGGLLQDVTSLRSLIYYLRIPIIAKCLGKKTMVFAQGIGPIQTKKGKLYTKLALNYFVDKITVRDEESKKLLLDLGVKKQVAVTADMALLLECAADKESNFAAEKYGIPKGNCCGVVLRNWNGIEPLIPLIGKAISEFSRKVSLTPVLLSFQPEMDNVITLALQKKISVPSIAITDPLLPKEFLEIISNFEILIGMRYHSLIFSSICQVPFGGIAYDPKVKQLAVSLGFPWIPYEELNRESLFGLLSELWKNRAALKKSLSEKLPLLRNKSEKNLIEAANLMNPARTSRF